MAQKSFLKYITFIIFFSKDFIPFVLSSIECIVDCNRTVSVSVLTRASYMLHRQYILSNIWTDQWPVSDSQQG